MFVGKCKQQKDTQVTLTIQQPLEHKLNVSCTAVITIFGLSLPDLTHFLPFYETFS